ncbi:MAG: ABC transporter permease [Candidatus Limivivens sp.]|nr:ABC transporter permease [Candidatus Limivivens sp.]
MKINALWCHILTGFLTLFCIITINFLLIRFMPGDPVKHIIGEDQYFKLELENPERLEEIRAEYGLDKTLFTQYTTYLNKTLHLDFGNSYRIKTPVLKTVLFRMRWTLVLTVPAILISALLGGILGAMAGWKPGGKLDMILSPVFMILSSIPSNCLAILCLLIFSFRLKWFPLAGITSGGLEGTEKLLDILWHMALPLMILVLFKTASDYMLMKSTAEGICQEEYITVARGKGLSDGEVIFRHVLKNALCPYITSLCMQFGHILSGSMMVEIVFSWKGMGTLIYESVSSKDFPMLQTCFLFIGICIIVFNFIADLLNILIDPRLRKGD